MSSPPKDKDKELKAGHPPAGLLEKYFLVEARVFFASRCRMQIHDVNFVRIFVLFCCVLVVKAGGMRITSKHHPSQHPVPTPEEKAEEEEFAEPKEK